MNAKPKLRGLRAGRRLLRPMHHEPGRHRRAKRRVGTTVGTAGSLLLSLAIVVPVVLQAGAGAASAATARLSASARALTPVNTPSPRLPIKIPPPVRLTVTPHRAVGDLVPFDYTVRWSQTRKPVGLPGEKPRWLVSTRFYLMQPDHDILVWSQQRLLPISMRKYSGTQELTPGVWKIVSTVEDARGEIGWDLEVVEVIKPPPPAPRPTTPQPTTPAPRPTTPLPTTPAPHPTTTTPKTPAPQPPTATPRPIATTPTMP